MRILTVSQLISELHALAAARGKQIYGAPVNLTLDASYREGAVVVQGTFDGAAEVVEEVFLPEGPAVRICSRNGAKV